MHEESEPRVKFLIMKIYTKGGDKGKTSLVSGKRVLKSNLRIDAYGTMDELVTFIAAFRDQLNQQEIKNTLIHIQSALMVISSHLANDSNEIELQLPEINPAWTGILEKEIDDMDKELVPLRSFVIPGGHPQISQCHICRVMCRKAERKVVAMEQSNPVHATIVPFLNRLSDYFFTLSRYLCKDLGIDEIKWEPELDWE